MKALIKTLANNIYLIAGITLLTVTLSFIGVKAYSERLNSNSPCTGICVALTADGMKPDSIAVKVGEFVQFNTKDGKTHNISLGAGEYGSETQDHGAHSTPHEHIGDYSSGDFKAGEAWRVQFKKPGTYRLHDHHNPKLEILIVVYEPGAVDKIQ